MPFPDGAIDVSDVSEQVGVRISDADHIVKAVTVEISEAVTKRTSSWAGAARLARGYAATHARTGYYMHALVADTIAKQYQRQAENS